MSCVRWGRGGRKGGEEVYGFVGFSYTVYRFAWDRMGMNVRMTNGGL